MKMVGTTIMGLTSIQYGAPKIAIYVHYVVIGLSKNNIVTFICTILLYDENN